MALHTKLALSSEISALCKRRGYYVKKMISICCMICACLFMTGCSISQDIYEATSRQPIAGQAPIGTYQSMTDSQDSAPVSNDAYVHAFYSAYNDSAEIPLEDPSTNSDDPMDIRASLGRPDYLVRIHVQSNATLFSQPHISFTIQLFNQQALDDLYPLFRDLTLTADPTYTTDELNSIFNEVISDKTASSRSYGSMQVAYSPYTPPYTLDTQLEVTLYY